MVYLLLLCNNLPVRLIKGAREMDGSDNPAVGAVLLCILVVINAIHHGF